MATSVFISAGTPADDAQKEFRDAVVNAINLAGFTPRLMEPRDWDYKNPLRGMRRVMDECHGAVVVAYARYEVEAGKELRREGQRPLESVAFPTAWNQIEAAMAFEKGLPLLVVAENRLRREALLDSANDVRPFWTDLDPSIGRSDGFRGYLQSWKRDVEQLATDPTHGRPSTRDLSTGQVLSSLRWVDLLVVLTTLFGTLLAALTIGYRVGRGEWPFG
jgi:hypothetical protein